MALSLRPRDAEALSFRGMALALLGRWDEAERSAAEAIRREPDQVAFRGNLEQILDRRGRIETRDATARNDWPTLERAARAWTRTRPNQTEAWRAVARATFEQGRHLDAVDAIRRVTALEPVAAANLAALGGLLLHALRYDEAGETLERALALDPDDVSALTSRGTLFTYLGRFEAAERDLRRALARAPDHAPAYTLLSRLTGGRLAQDDRRRLEVVAADATQPPDQRIPAAFALAHALDAEGRIDDAFAAYARAHAIAAERDQREGRVHDHAAAKARARAIAALPLDRLDGAAPEPRPIFVVGMARSGTTLVEAVLAAHPRVLGAGERVVMPSLLEAWLAGRAPDEGWRRAYLEGLGDLDGRDHVTDKMPRNLEAVGLIHRLFPDAPIVLVRRDPVETCLSLYRQEFSRDWSFAHDLVDLGRAYALNARMAAHWERAAPGRMIQVQYETFAGDFEPQARRLVEACGLDWDPACAAPHRSSRPIATFSTVSARRPVRVMNDRARAYRSLLEPLIATLEAEGVDLATGALRRDVDQGLK